VTDRRASLLLWFGVIAPPLAWTLELVAGYWFEEAVCGRGSGRWGIDHELTQAATLVVCGALAVAGTLAALAALRAVRAGAGDARGRVEFLAVTSLSAAAVFVLLTVMTGAGVLALDPCKG
jgi:hypothetical protein